MPRTMKTFDTADPITGVVTATDPITGVTSRADLTVYDAINFHFKVEGASVYVGGTAIDVETADGSGGIDPADGLPVNRGRFRYEQVPSDVDTAAIYNCELECILVDGRKVHFPNDKAEDDQITITNDLSGN
jgi:hypothetical protein